MQVVSMQNIRKSCVCAAAAAVHSFAKSPASTDRVVEGAQFLAVVVDESRCKCRFCYGYFATGQGLLDWFEVDLSARPASSFGLICVVSRKAVARAAGTCK